MFPDERHKHVRTHMHTHEHIYVDAHTRNIKRFIYVYECFAQMYVCAPCVWLVPTKDRRRHWIHCPWSYGLL